MFRPNWLPSSGVQIVEETAAPLLRCYTLDFEGIKYLKTLFLKYHAVTVLLYVKRLHTAPKKNQHTNKLFTRPKHVHTLLLRL
jgi:hypothetical protein